MTKFLVVALVAVCALTASLYATAAPTKQGPTNVQLAAQVRDLKERVRTLEADGTYLFAAVKQINACQVNHWRQVDLPVWFAIRTDNADILSSQPQEPACL